MLSVCSAPLEVLISLLYWGIRSVRPYPPILLEDLERGGPEELRSEMDEQEFGYI